MSGYELDLLEELATLRAEKARAARQLGASRARALKPVRLDVWARCRALERLAEGLSEELQARLTVDRVTEDARALDHLTYTGPDGLTIQEAP